MQSAQLLPFFTILIAFFFSAMCGYLDIDICYGYCLGLIIEKLQIVGFVTELGLSKIVTKKKIF